MPDDTQLTTKEVADELGVQHTTVKQWIFKKLLHAVKRGRDNYIDRSELERFKGEHSPKPGPKPRKNK